MDTSPDNDLQRTAGHADQIEAQLSAARRQVVADGDGMTNAAESKAGTDPLNPSSRPAATARSAGPGGGGFSMTFPTVVGKGYAVENSEMLAGWSALTSGTAGTEGDVQFNDPSMSGTAQRSYRVRVELGRDKGYG